MTRTHSTTNSCFQFYPICTGYLVNHTFKKCQFFMNMFYYILVPKLTQNKYTNNVSLKSFLCWSFKFCRVRWPCQLVFFIFSWNKGGVKVQSDPFKDIYQALSLPLKSSVISFALVKKFTVRETKDQSFSCFRYCRSSMKLYRKFKEIRSISS